MQCLSIDPRELFGFAYLLRTQDKDNIYSEDILQGNIKPDILVDIFMSNQWDPSTETLQPIKQTAFQLVQGQNDCLRIEAINEETRQLKVSNDPNNSNLIQFQLVKDSGVRVLIDNFEVGVHEERHLRMGIFEQLLLSTIQNDHE